MQLGNIAVTHGGKFHADDVFSSALLKIINPKIKITRVMEIPADFEGLAFDIGGGKFDHHQENAEVRENGIPYAAFGLLWRELGASLVGEQEAERLDEKFIQPLDLDDNTGSGSQIAGIISSFNPSWDSEEEPDTCFERAVEFAKIILLNKFENYQSIKRAANLVKQALETQQDNIVILPRFAPWKMVLAPSKAEFVVYPSQRGGYNAQGVPKSAETNELKCTFPEEWFGKPEEVLVQLSGIPTLKFCHKSGFLISIGTLEDALRACRMAQNKTE